ncbi:MAG: nitroreductase/quinone reductase family protein [Acidimicrobiia bacterium]
MVKEYRRTPMVRFVGWMMSGLARRGMGPSSVLTTIGRKTKKPHLVPVSPIFIEGREYLVAPYGQVGWVKNTRVRPQITLTRGKTEREAVATEVHGEEAARALAAYHQRETFARPYMDVPLDPTIEDFAARAANFPVFRIEPRP